MILYVFKLEYMMFIKLLILLQVGFNFAVMFAENEKVLSTPESEVNIMDMICINNLYKK